MGLYGLDFCGKGNLELVNEDGSQLRLGWSFLAEWMAICFTAGLGSVGIEDHIEFSSSSSKPCSIKSGDYPF